MRRIIQRLLREEEGMELLEWAIVAVLFALSGAVAMGALGTGLTLPVNEIAVLLSKGGGS
jgi:Flp pilus assembly pilin Flp